MPAQLLTSETGIAYGVVKLTNCRVVRGDYLVEEDLWLSSHSGRILDAQREFFANRTEADRTLDMGGRIVCAGFIETQLNGAFGFDFSVVPDKRSDYGENLARINNLLIQTGVTSYLPTVTSQPAAVYQQVLPFLGPSGADRSASRGAESLGAHCEGPFISRRRNGIHSLDNILEPSSGIYSLESCYGPGNLHASNTPIRVVTLAPELPGAVYTIEALSSRGIIPSIGHTDATYEEALSGVDAGAKTVTHLFNAMRPLHHRNPGVFGLLGTAPSALAHSIPLSPGRTRGQLDPIDHERYTKPYFGIITDGIHVHPSVATLAYSFHPDGMIIVSDAMPFQTCPDGLYPAPYGSHIRKTGNVLTLEEMPSAAVPRSGDLSDSVSSLAMESNTTAPNRNGTVEVQGKLAGSSSSLLECVENFWNWVGSEVPLVKVLATVTSTPAKMLGCYDTKGCLQPGADADLVVLEDGLEQSGRRTLKVTEVWKFGVRVHTNEE